MERKELPVMKNAQYESPIKALLESLESNFANTVNPKGSLEIEQLVVDGFLAHQARQENNTTKESIFKGTCYDEDMPRIATGNRLLADMYDDACHLMSDMQELRPLDYIKWFMLIGYTEDAAIELLERELGGVVYGTDYRIKWAGCKGCGEYSGDDLSEGIGTELVDHYYMVVPESDYKWEATFETYGEARAYIDEWCTPKGTAQ